MTKHNIKHMNKEKTINIDKEKKETKTILTISIIMITLTIYGYLSYQYHNPNIITIITGTPIFAIISIALLTYSIYKIKKTY